jgi:glycosyltransferase involved in cell wall biosynthesis
VTVRLLHIVSHTIQYQAPLFRRIAGELGIDLRVLFTRDLSGGYYDRGFSREIRWDVSLREGYDNVLWHETDWKREIAGCDALWVHGWQGPKLLRAIGHAHAVGKPVLMRAENTDDAMPDGRGPRGALKRRFLEWLFARCARFLAIGSANRDYYLRRGVAAEQIFPMPYAVDNDFFADLARAARPHRNDLRRELALGDRPVILYAGKLIERKHPERLLRAWTGAPWPAAKPALLFVGDGELRSALERNAPDDVRFAGFRNQTELPALYDLADVFVLPAEKEPWGLAVNESMACATAVVVGDRVGCAPDLVDPTCGAVVPNGDEAALGRALIDVLGRAEAAGMAASRKIDEWSFAADVRGLRAALASLQIMPRRSP